MPLTSVLLETERSVTLETSNVAVSVRPFGTVLGVQLVAVFQSLLAGLKFHVALPARAHVFDRLKKAPLKSSERRRTEAGSSVDFHRLISRRGQG